MNLGRTIPSRINPFVSDRSLPHTRHHCAPDSRSKNLAKPNEHPADLSSTEESDHCSTHLPERHSWWFETGWRRKKGSTEPRMRWISGCLKLGTTDIDHSVNWCWLSFSLFSSHIQHQASITHHNRITIVVVNEYISRCFKIVSARVSREQSLFKNCRMLRHVVQSWSGRRSHSNEWPEFDLLFSFVHFRTTGTRSTWFPAAAVLIQQSDDQVTKRKLCLALTARVVDSECFALALICVCRLLLCCSSSTSSSWLDRVSRVSKFDWEASGLPSGLSTASRNRFDHRCTLA